MKLKLAIDLSLPLDAATESFAILGRRGSGKTHTAVVMAEEMLKAGVQVVVIDPLDVWWGLRVSKDGKTAGFPIYVAGGSHADIPLSADTGQGQISDREAAYENLIDMLQAVEWVRQSAGNKYACPFCHGITERDGGPGHADDCRWVKAVSTPDPLASSSETQGEKKKI